MAADKIQLKQKLANKRSNSGPASETVKLILRTKHGAQKDKYSITKRNRVYVSCSEDNTNLYKSFDYSPLNYIKQFPLGSCSASNLRKHALTCIINNLSRNIVPTTLNSFERRVTAIEWHPKYSQIVVAGSRGGDLSLYNLNKPGTNFIPGIGPGGSIVGLKFHPDDPSLVCTTSLAGDVRVDDFNGIRGKTLTSCLEHWFSSLDVCCDRKLLLSGNTAGKVCLMTLQGEKLWNTSKHLHKKKVTHVEFSALDPSIFVTASADASVKLWDLRMMSNSELKPEPFQEFFHDRGVNSACFSPSNRHSLLTTDQHEEIHVYKSPVWDEQLVIGHPHNQLKHLTPIKATWHPLEDLIIIGRFLVCKNNVFSPCGMDFFDGSTGTLVHRLKSPTGRVLSLNSFNISGDCLASCSGSCIIFWKDKNVFDGAAYQKSMGIGQGRMPASLI